MRLRDHRELIVAIAAIVIGLAYFLSTAGPLLPNRAQTVILTASDLPGEGWRQIDPPTRASGALSWPNSTEGAHSCFGSYNHNNVTVNVDVGLHFFATPEAAGEAFDSEREHLLIAYQNNITDIDAADGGFVYISQKGYPQVTQGVVWKGETLYCIFVVSLGEFEGRTQLLEHLLDQQSRKLD